MRPQRIKLVWGAADVIRGRWYLGLFGFYNRVDGEPDDGLAISLRGLVRWALVSLMLGYVAATMALFSFWQRNPYCLLTYGDALLYPVRRAEVAAKKGQAFISEGQELAKAGKWVDAARLLKQGLTLYPGDHRGRLTLAKFYVMASQRAQAVKLLGEGLDREYPGRAYLMDLVDLAEQGEDYGLVLTTADRYLPAMRGAAFSVDRRWLIGRKFNALIASQRKADALALAGAEEPGAFADELQVLALLELGRAADAADYLALAAKRPNADLALLRRLEVRANREAGRLDEMDRAIEDLRALDPSDARAAVYGVVQRVLAKREESARVAMDDFIFRFGGMAENLKLVAQPLAEVGVRTLFERCLAAAAERGYALQPLRGFQVQMHLKRGEWEEAEAALAQLKPASGRNLAGADEVWLGLMRRLVPAVSTPSEAAQISLVEFLRSRPWPIRIFRTCVESLRVARHAATAREAIAVAERMFPGSHWVQVQKAELGQELAALPITDAVAPVGQSLTEKVFFDRLGEMVRGQQWDGARSLIDAQQVRRPRPDWWKTRDSDLQLAEVRINQGRGEVPAMLGAARIYLDGTAERSQRIVEVATEFYAGGGKLEALALLQALVKRTPEHAQAKRLLAEWKQRLETK